MTATLAPRPVPARPRPPVAPAIQHADVDGVPALRVDVPGQPFVAVRLLWPNGWLSEPAGREGVANLTARTMAESSAALSADAFAMELERHGMFVEAGASPDSFEWYGHALASAISRGLEIGLEGLVRPRLGATEIERQRGQVLDARRRNRAEPGQLAREVLRGTIFPEQRFAYSGAGTFASLAALTPADVADHHAGLLAGPAVLVVAGDVSRLEGLTLPPAVRELIGPSALPAVPALTAPATDVLEDGAVAPGAGQAAAAGPATAPIGARTVLIDRPGSVQSVLALGHEGPAASASDSVALAVGETLAGGTFTSRLNHQLREVRGFTYTARARFHRMRGLGLFEVITAVDTPVTVPALLDVDRVIERLLADGPSAAEIEDARSYLLVRQPLQLETVNDVASVISQHLASGLPPDYLAQVQRELPGIERPAVVAALRRHLRPRDLVRVIVGDAAVVHAPLEDAGFGPVEVLRPEDLPG